MSGWTQGTTSVTYKSIADDGVQSLSGALDAGGSFRGAVTDTAGALPGNTIIVSFRRVAALGGTYAVRSYGGVGMALAAFDTALTGTTGTDGEITFSVRASGALEIENRSGGLVDVGVTFDIRSV